MGRGLPLPLPLPLPSLLVERRSRVVVARAIVLAMLVGTPHVGWAAGPTVPPPATKAARVAPLATILSDVKAPGALAVLVNVWATWCEPCLEELPDVLRFYRDNRGHGLRLVLVSADDEDRAGEVDRVLGGAIAAAGFGDTFDGHVFVKHENDMRFIDGLDHEWSGALPATFLFDGHGQRTHAWHGPVTYDDLRGEIANRLTSPPAGIKKKSISRRNP